MRTSTSRFLVLVTALLVPATSARGGDPREGGIGDFREVVRDATKKVFPAVVFVECIQESHEEGKKEGAEVTGSGVLISASGEFVTNWHVVDQPREVRCLLFDGSAFHAKILGATRTRTSRWGA